MGVKINYVKKAPDLGDAVKQVSAAKMANMAEGPGHISVKYDELTSTQQTMKEVMEKAFEGIDDNDPMALSKGVANFQKIVKGEPNKQQVPKKVVPSNPLKGMFGKKSPEGAPLTAKGQPFTIVVSPSDVVVETTEGTVTILGQYAQQQAQWHEALEWAKDHVDEDLPTGEMMKQTNELAEAYMEAGGAPAGYGDDDEGADGDGYAPAYQQNLTPMPPDPDPQPFDHEDPKAFKKVMASFYMTLVKKPVQPKKG